MNTATLPTTWAARAERVIAPTYTRPAHVFVSGQGASLFDEDGQRFLDMTSGVAVNALGHGSPLLAEAEIDMLLAEDGEEQPS